MPVYTYRCDNPDCGSVQDRWSTIANRNRDLPCHAVGCEGRVHRSLSDTISTVHTAPVPGTGNHPYIRKLEEKADRIKKSGGVSPNADHYIAEDQKAWQEKR